MAADFGIKIIKAVKKAEQKRKDCLYLKSYQCKLEAEIAEVEEEMVMLWAKKKPFPDLSLILLPC